MTSSPEESPKERTLRDCREGERAVIRRLVGTGSFRRRLMEMGFLPGTIVEIVKYAPLRDPIEFVVKGYHVSLRRDEAEKIILEDEEPS